MNIKGFRRMLFGEKMPDKNDPKYKERYERDVDAGRRFAKATRIDKAVAKVQGFANAHRTLFLVIVFGFAICGLTWNNLPPDGGVPPSSGPPNGHGNAGFRAPGTA